MDTHVADLARKAFEALYSPGLAHAYDEPSPDPRGQWIAAVAVGYRALQGTPSRRIVLVNVQNGAVRDLTHGLGEDWSPRWSPGGDALAFLSTRTGRPSIHVWRRDALGDALALPDPQNHVIETFRWSPNGRQLLVLAAEVGADLAGRQGSASHEKLADAAPSWAPTVSEGAFCRRRAFVIDAHERACATIDTKDFNVWECAWLGADRIAAVASRGAGEEAWYGSEIISVHLNSGVIETLYRPSNQVAELAGNATGDRLAFVEAIASDRGNVCGECFVLAGEGVARLDTHGVDASALTWIDDRRLLVTGVRGLDTVVAEASAAGGWREHYAARDRHAGFYYPTAHPAADGGVVLALQTFSERPHVAYVRDGEVRVIARPPGGQDVSIMGVEPVFWSAPDDLELQGWLLRPRGSAPYPLVMEIHGGPVWLWRPVWLGQMPLLAALLSAGFAVFLPNPRGSTGRGSAFVAAVKGDMGGADTMDYLSGVDALVERGIADPKRLYVTGSSYGGFMSAWLITQTDRFAAAAPRAPVTDWRLQHWTSNIPYFDTLFLDDDPDHIEGKHAMRSPVNYADRVRTPVTITAGALDRCTPPSQAGMLHAALLAQGAESKLVVYPREGHGLQNYEERLDAAIRLIKRFSTRLT